MSLRPTLHDFVEDELLRAPLALDQVIDAVLALWQRQRPAAARLDVDPVRMLSRHRHELVGAAVQKLRQQVLSEIAGAAPSAPGAVAAARPAELSLIDEEEIASDIEVTRAVELVKAAAEFELRELQALTSALADDVNVARDTNAFRPDTYVRSMWRGVTTLPVPRGLQVAFMRDAAEPLARTLRQVYAAACGRLEERGIEPAAYRTIVVAVTTRGNLDLPMPGGGRLADLRDSLPMPLRASPAPAAAPATVAEPTAAAPKTDPRLAHLLSKLFDAMRADAALPAPLLELLQRLQPAALGAAAADPSVLEAYEHPVWRFIDAMAFMFDGLPAADRGAGLAHCRLLVEQLVADRAADGHRFQWATTRLAEFDRHLLERSVAAAQPVIARLHAAADTASMPLDVGSLDTVPAELLPEAPAPLPPAEFVAGTRLRVFLRGEWRLLRLLWADPATDLWLLSDIAHDGHWALRRQAFDRLLAEHLAKPLTPRSLIRAAAERVLKAVDASGGEPG